MHDLPDIALSVRQPWAWAIIHSTKDVENRSIGAVNSGRMRDEIGRRIAIHASKGMLQDEYVEAMKFMREIGIVCPPANHLLRGGIIGSVLLEAIVKKKGSPWFSSPWFFGPLGLALRDKKECPFVGVKGELGMFRWQPSGAQAEPPSRWMMKRLELRTPVVDLFQSER